MSFSLERTTNDLQDEALAVAEGAAKAAFGTRFKRVPRALFAKLSLPVISVIAVVAFVFGATMDVLRKWAAAADSIQRETTLLSFWSLTLHEYVLSFTTTLAMVMYLCCVYRDPGRVPAGYAPDPESLLANGALVELKRKGGSRFCKKCVKHKPPRAHHCRQCNRCVLRMDHHCVWVNNCVGHRNYKSFFLFLFYVVVSIWHATSLLASHAYLAGFANEPTWRDDSEVYRKQHRGASAASAIPVGVAEVAALTLAVPLTLALTLLFAWHCYLVSRNKTTIEHYEGVRASSSSSAGGAVPPLHATEGEARHPYSLGLRANLREILGPRVLCWLAPGCSIAGDGLAFANVAEYGKWKRARARREEELTLS